MNKKIMLFLLLSLLVQMINICALHDTAFAYSEDFTEAKGVTASLQNNSGVPLAPAGGAVAENAIDKNPSTYAQASGEWIWTLHIDLGQIRQNVNTVAVAFCETDPKMIPANYCVMVSKDGTEWNNVAEITGNTSNCRRVHKFLPTDVRYVRIRDTQRYLHFKQLTQMAISEVNVYAESDNMIDAQINVPNDGFWKSDSNIEINFNKRITDAYLSKVRLLGDNGEVECSRHIGSDGKSVVLDPVADLQIGQYYNVEIKDFQSWRIMISDGNLTKNASVSLISPTLGIPFETQSECSAVNAIDGNTATYAHIQPGGNTGTDPYYPDWTMILQLDFNTIYHNVSRVALKFEKETLWGIPAQYKILASTDGAVWKETGRYYSYDEEYQVCTFTPVDARYIRIQGISGRMAIAEVDVSSVPDLSSPIATVIADSNANTPVVVQFNKEIKKESVNSKTVVLKNKNNDVPCRYVFQDKKTLLVYPEYGLDYLTNYVFELTDGIVDLSGNALMPVMTSFVTESKKELTIVTESTLTEQEYINSNNKENSIYPAFVDNLKYQSWTEDGSLDYYQVKADGGCAPYSFSVIDGAMPEGLSITEDGKIYGIPTKEEKTYFTLRVTDSKGDYADKMLSMTANPYRAKWFADARYGIMNQWGYTSTSIYDPSKNFSDIKADFERIINAWNIESYAAEVADSGAKVLNMSFLAGDSIRLWPSKSTTAYETKISRNVVGELADALHKRGIKLISYVATAYSWVNNATFQDYDDITRTVSQFNINMSRELLELGVDGFWFDSGNRAGFNDWQSLVAMIRSTNPYAVIESNPGSGSGGYIPGYPDTDIEVFEAFEGATHSLENRMQTGSKAGVRKKMAVEVTFLLGNKWSYQSGSYTMANVSDIINAIQKNWDNDVTVMLVPFSDPENNRLILDSMQSTFDEVTAWVKNNIDCAGTPTVSVKGGTYSESIITQINYAEGESDGVIRYTIDGSTPTETNGTVISAGEYITVDKSLQLKAAVFNATGKGKSRIMTEDYVIKNTAGVKEMINCRLVSVPTEHAYDTYMTGMLITVGQNDIAVDGVGRLATGTDGDRHKIVIKGEAFGAKPIGEAELICDYEKNPVDSFGFQYADLPGVILKANKTYFVLCEEGENSIFMNVSPRSADFDWTFGNEDIYCNEALYSDETCTYIFYKSRENAGLVRRGQILNLRYRVLTDNAVSENLALGAYALMLPSEENAKAAGGQNVALQNVLWRDGFVQNAVDGDMSSVAYWGRPSPLWGENNNWTLWIDLRETKNISKITVTQSGGFEKIETSSDNITWTDGITNGASFSERNVRYVRIKNKYGGTISNVDIR